MNRIIVFVGPSGVGKTAITNILCHKYSNFKANISCKTKKKRFNEINGQDYFFMGENEFKEKIENNEFIEHNFYNGFYYGTLKSQVEGILRNYNCILIINPSSICEVKELEFFKKHRAIIFFLNAKDKILKERLVSRGDSKEDIIERIKLAKIERKFANCCDYIVNVVDLRKSSQEIYNFLQK